MGVYNNLVIEALDYAIKNESDVFDFPFPRFGVFAGDIKKDQFITVAGRLGSGKTSFVDYTYVIHLFIEWRKAQAKGSNKKFKIFYFSLNHNKQFKIQKWTSLFLYLKEGALFDIATLNNEKSQMLPVDDKFQVMVSEAESFFDAMLDTDVVEIIEGAISPSRIFNKVTDYMDTIGSNVHGEYLIDQEYEGGHFSVIVDSTDKLSTEQTKYGSLSKEEILQNMNDYALKFKEYYKMSTILIYPTPAGIMRGPKDSEPKYGDLGIFATDTDKGFVMYDLHGERNYIYMGMDSKSFISSTGINRLRVCSLVKNKTGPNNVSVPLGFYPENGYLVEMPSMKESSDFEQMRLNLYNNE